MIRQLNTLMYPCTKCHWLTPLRPDSPRQLCPRCIEQAEQEPGARVVYWAEVMCGLFIAFMVGFIIGRVWL